MSKKKGFGSNTFYSKVLDVSDTVPLENSINFQMLKQESY